MLEIIIPVALVTVLLLVLWWKREWLLRMARRNHFLREKIDRAAAETILRQKDDLPPEAKKMLEKNLRGNEDQQVRALQEASDLAEQGKIQEAAERLRQKPRTASDGRSKEKARSKRRSKRKAAKQARRRSR